MAGEGGGGSFGGFGGGGGKGSFSIACIAFNRCLSADLAIFEEHIILLRYTNTSKYRILGRMYSYWLTDVPFFVVAVAFSLENLDEREKGWGYAVLSY